MKKLSQVLAVEKMVKSRFQSTIDEAYKAIQKPALFNGFQKSYTPKDEADETLPPERMQVQMRVSDTLAEVSARMSEMFDIEATKDWGNCEAAANVVVNGVVLIEEAPATYLLFLEKKLVDLQTFISKLPTLDETEAWTFDDAVDLYKTPPVATLRTKKEQRPIVLYDATEHHPAQTQLITQDVTVGTWSTTKHSGAITKRQRAAMLDRVETLLSAVRQAREAANTVEVPDVTYGKDLLDYVLGS